MKITIPDKPVFKKKLFEDALKENMDKISYKQMEWGNTNDKYPHEDIWF